MATVVMGMRPSVNVIHALPVLFNSCKHPQYLCCCLVLRIVHQVLCPCKWDFFILPF